jgi:hypothetical protein
MSAPLLQCFALAIQYFYCSVEIHITDTLLLQNKYKSTAKCQKETLILCVDQPFWQGYFFRW